MANTPVLLKHCPTLTADDATELASRFYGLTVKASPLPSERDQNFLLRADSGEQFVLKIANALESAMLLDAQNLVLEHLSQHVSTCPRVIQTPNNESIVEIKSAESNTHLVRLITYLPGTPLADVPQYSPELLFDLGQKLGQLDRALVQFDHQNFHRDFHWDLAHGPRVVAEHNHLIRDQRLRDLVSSINDLFVEYMTPLLPQLRKSVIHGDANDYNVLVDQDADEVSGIVDFGDMVYSLTAGELAVATAYILLRTEDPIAATLSLARGYRAEFSLTNQELDALWPLILMRLCMSVSLAAYQRQQQPHNDYLSISQQAINENLPQLAELSWPSIAAKLREQ